MRAIVISLTMFAAAVSCAAPDIEPTVEGDVLEFTAHDLDGNPVTHKDERFQNKVVLIDIWGTWCPPCRDSIPKLVEMQGEHEDDLVIVGVAFEEIEDDTERREHLKTFAEKNEMNYLVLDGGTKKVEEVFSTLKGFRGFPTMIIIGRNGEVTHANTVFVPIENKKIEGEVEKALGTNENG